MFFQSQNDNGTFNTRCLDCLMTVATSVESPEELARIEAHHCCAEKALLQMLACDANKAEQLATTRR
jgi:hypothetical protein